MGTIRLLVLLKIVCPKFLFSLYINDFHRFSEKLKFAYFADNFTLYASTDDLAELCQMVNDELIQVIWWLNGNFLSLNTKKLNSYYSLTKM